MSCKSKITLTPIHPAWPTFHLVLGERLKAGAENNTSCVCKHSSSMPMTLQALGAIGLAQRNVLRTREFFRERGLDCDCKVWSNPDVLLRVAEPEREPWWDEDGNFDADAYYWSEIRPYEDEPEKTKSKRKSKSAKKS